ncbi:hypothetical protein HP570_20350 [Brevibacillus sp. RS1.1]|uniref:hypothetical protein n=1 Tax=Brevibacillus sp. RS1.1 TaxID=2738982 RepID=UPI00156B5B40|nr:hypothetical protein [Brevibacillus sp. RS1.1]NRR04569.1 hypothetical protein [Brevibacillus sp. RS1.1]
MDELVEKQKFHALADEKNYIGERRGRKALLCGARRKRVDARCRQYAGAGTSHPGYGRYKFCGGNNTGPKTAAGKSTAAQNSRVHGLYASALDEEELEIYQELAQQKDLGLEHAIYVLKAKVIRYLRQWKGTNERRREKTTLETGEYDYSWYRAGTIEDRPLLRALAELGRLVEKQSRLNPDQGTDLLSQINAELRAASQGKVSISWGGAAQQRINPDEQQMPRNP